MKLVELISEGCKTPNDITSKLKQLFAGTLEKMLEAEMDEHLGYEKNSILDNNSGNSRNGYGKKTIKSEWGESEISVPRDRPEHLSRRLLKNGRPELMIWKLASLQCTKLTLQRV